LGSSKPDTSGDDFALRHFGFELAGHGTDSYQSEEHQDMFLRDVQGRAGEKVLAACQTGMRGVLHSLTIELKVLRPQGFCERAK
jgi:hypothetical protein